MDRCGAWKCHHTVVDGLDLFEAGIGSLPVRSDWCWSAQPIVVMQRSEELKTFASFEMRPRILQADSRAT
jgi:hypothetical protein